MHTEIARIVLEYTHDAGHNPISGLEVFPNSALASKKHLGKGLIEHSGSLSGEIFSRAFHPFKREHREHGTVHQYGRNRNGRLLVSFTVIDLVAKPHHSPNGFDIRAGITNKFYHRPAEMCTEKSLVYPVVLHPEHLLVPFEIGVIGRIPAHLHHQDHRRRKSDAHTQDIDQRRNACLSEYFHCYSFFNASAGFV